jgi:hypothetical protein
MKTKYSVIFIFALFLSCASLNNRQKVILKKKDGTKVTCFKSPSDVAYTSSSLNFKAIDSHINAIASVKTKIDRIREEIPGINSIEAIEFRMCNAYANGIIDSSTYNKFIDQILPALKVRKDIAISENNVGENYMRLFGAFQTPMLMRLISGGKSGFISNSSKTNHSLLYDDESKNDCDYCQGYMSPNIIDFWEKKWEYSDILPLNTTLWQKATTQSEEYGKDLFWTTSITDRTQNDSSPTKNAWCWLDTLSPMSINDEQVYQLVFNEETGESKCNSNPNEEIGFLFIILENFSKNRLDDIELVYKHLPNTSNMPLKSPSINEDMSVEDFERSIMDISREELIGKIGNAEIKENELRRTEEKSLFLPKMLPNQSVIWILSIYIKDKSGYPVAYLSDITQPVKIRYKVEDKILEESIRQPYKDKAMKINLPWGWYNQ